MQQFSSSPGGGKRKLASDVQSPTGTLYVVHSASAPGSPLRVVQVLLRCDATLSSLDVVEDRDVVEVESEILDQTIATFYRLYYRSRFFPRIVHTHTAYANM